jgi:hypothetical protein
MTHKVYWRVSILCGRINCFGDMSPKFSEYMKETTAVARPSKWRVGQKYLLFLFYSVADKSWALDGCGNSGELDREKYVLEQIDAIQSPTDGGVIHGTVSGRTISDLLVGVRVEARGIKGLHTATTNANGEFEIKVPAGKYTLRAIRPGLHSGPPILVMRICKTFESNRVAALRFNSSPVKGR